MGMSVSHILYCNYGPIKLFQSSQRIRCTTCNICIAFYSLCYIRMTCLLKSLLPDKVIDGIRTTPSHLLFGGQEVPQSYTRVEEEMEIEAYHSRGTGRPQLSLWSVIQSTDYCIIIQYTVYWLIH